MEKKKAPFMLAFVAILLCSSSSSILCSNIEADEDMAELELGGATTSGGPLLDSCNCNQICLTNADCNTCPNGCGYCNHNLSTNQKECGPSGLIKLPVTDEENIRIDQ